jgi:hypothetical protein
MQWLALANWILVAAAALFVVSVPLPSLATQMLAAFGGLGTIIVFAAEGTRAFAWISVGLGCAGFILLAVGSRTLVTDADGTMEWAAQSRKELAAAAAGFELPFILTAAVLSAGAIYI